MDIESLERWVISKLEDDLPPMLYYHSVKHTKDVQLAARRLCKAQNINGEKGQIVDAAALLHDAGFLISYDDHEEHGCEIARRALPDFGYSTTQIDIVCRLIMATKVPQQPKDILEYIICDADLDYLWREDFFEIGERLFREFHARGIVEDFCGWDRLQVGFLEDHRYFTPSNLSLREARKNAHLEKIKQRLAACL